MPFPVSDHDIVVQLKVTNTLLERIAVALEAIAASVKPVPNDLEITVGPKPGVQP
jgi:hypothetical protein